jgi:ComF family protein
MNSWLKYIQFRVFPSSCTLCGAPGMQTWDICEACFNSLPINELACTRCAIPLTEGNIGVCGQCLQQPPLYQRCLTAWRYEPPLDYFIQHLKFNKDLVFARLMAALFAEYLEKFYAKQVDKPEVIIPVPLHNKRLRERGFNQSVEIAKVIARQLNIPLDLTACARPKMTQPQAELPAEERKRNIKGAFTFNPSAAYQHIALVDDVMTTGHTINELTNTVQKVSKSAIDVWVCARANR